MWQQLAVRRERLPHALLLKGRSGIGKLDFASALVRSLLCLAPDIDGYACGACASCGWILQNNHPDYRLLSPEQDGTEDDDAQATGTRKKKAQIAIAQIRELSGFLELSSHRNDGIRIVLIHPAEALNASSANALLKMLEEPPGNVVFILVSHQPQRLLPTILSRCHQLDMPVPDTVQALSWLADKGLKNAAEQLDYAGGSPLAVLAISTETEGTYITIWEGLSHINKLDVFSLATSCVTLGMETAINVLQKWIYDLFAYRLTGQVRYHPRYLNALQRLSERVDLGLLMAFQRNLVEAKKSALHPLNNELQLENLLISYAQLFAAKA